MKIDPYGLTEGEPLRGTSKMNTEGILPQSGTGGELLH
jgi:hypothetical protein